MNLSPLIERIEALEKQKRRVMLVDGAGKIIDDESYAADEPIILDVRQLTK